MSKIEMVLDCVTLDDTQQLIAVDEDGYFRVAYSCYHDYGHYKSTWAYEKGAVWLYTIDSFPNVNNPIWDKMDETDYVGITDQLNLNQEILLERILKVTQESFAKLVNNWLTYYEHPGVVIYKRDDSLDWALCQKVRLEVLQDKFYNNKIISCGKADLAFLELHGAKFYIDDEEIDNQDLIVRWEKKDYLFDSVNDILKPFQSKVEIE